MGRHVKPAQWESMIKIDMMVKIVQHVILLKKKTRYQLRELIIDKKLKTETKRVTRLPGQICQIRPRRGRCL